MKICAAWQDPGKSFASSQSCNVTWMKHTGRMLSDLNLERNLIWEIMQADSHVDDFNDLSFCLPLASTLSGGSRQTTSRIGAAGEQWQGTCSKGLPQGSPGTTFWFLLCASSQRDLPWKSKWRRKWDRVQRRSNRWWIVASADIGSCAETADQKQKQWSWPTRRIPMSRPWGVATFGDSSVVGCWTWPGNSQTDGTSWA